jgi:cytochrome c biogenesis protein CcmG/thiol:disulfide interchange protein DsbE
MTRLSDRTVGFAAIGLAIFGFLALTAFSFVSGGDRVDEAVTSGSDTAANFTLTLFDGGEFFLSEHAGKPILVNFWASWCPPCREEAKLLQRTWGIYEDKGVVYVGVDTQDTEPAARAFLTDFGVTYPNGIDSDNAISRSYQAFDLPTTVFIDRKGTIVKRWIGAIPEQQLVGWLDEIIDRGTEQR